MATLMSVSLQHLYCIHSQTIARPTSTSCFHHSVCVLLLGMPFTEQRIAGLPPHGLLVLMPASMQLSASACRPPPSLTAALSFSRLPIQLSPAAVFSLNAIANAMRESATLRSRRLGKHGTTELGHPRTERHSMNETHTDHEPHKSSQPAAAAAAAAAATDDLRCGLFSMAPVLASRPGQFEPCVAGA